MKVKFAQLGDNALWQALVRAGSQNRLPHRSNGRTKQVRAPWDAKSWKTSKPITNR